LLSFTSRQKSCRLACYGRYGRVQSSGEVEAIDLTIDQQRERKEGQGYVGKKAILESEEAVAMLWRGERNRRLCHHIPISCPNSAC